MKIRYLCVQNFGPFKHDPLILDFRSPAGICSGYFVLCGSNGSGLTTTFEAILLAAGQPQRVRQSLRCSDIVVNATFVVDGVEHHAYIAKDVYHPVNIDVVYMSADRPLPVSFEGDMDALNSYWRNSQSFSTRAHKPTFFASNGGGVFLYPNGVPIQDLSSGQRDAIGMGAPILNGGVSGLILLDKPDRFTGPLWTPGIVRTLRRLAPNAQVIVATDNDDLWDDAMSWERQSL